MINLNGVYVNILVTYCKLEIYPVVKKSFDIERVFLFSAEMIIFKLTHLPAIDMSFINDGQLSMFYLC